MRKKVQVISPSDDITKIPMSSVEETKIKFEQRTKLEVEYSKNLFKKFDIKNVLQDIYDAYNDNSIDYIICYKGGSYARKILPFIDYNIISKNRKPMIGYSDNTILLNAIYLKTGNINIYGPTFSAFNMDEGFEFTLENFNRVVIEKQNFKINVSKEYSYDKDWYKNQLNRNFVKNKPLQVIKSGIAEGTILGGHLQSFDYLLSNNFEINDKDIILFLEQDGKENEYLSVFQEKLESIINKIGKDKIRGIFLGRSEIPINKEELEKLVKSLNINVPIACNMDFGHTTPTLSIPIGKKVKIKI